MSVFCVAMVLLSYSAKNLTQAAYAPLKLVT